jgi:hypothetical protein
LDRPDGRKYEGQWSNGKQNGKGYYTDEHGVRKLALWKDGKKEKWITEKQNYQEDENPGAGEPND